jgi:hypothetical protein
MPFTKLCERSLGTFVPIYLETSLTGEDKRSYRLWAINSYPGGSDFRNFSGSLPGN